MDVLFVLKSTSCFKIIILFTKKLSCSFFAVSPTSESVQFSEVFCIRFTGGIIPVDSFPSVVIFPGAVLPRGQYSGGCFFLR